VYFIATVLVKGPYAHGPRIDCAKRRRGAWRRRDGAAARAHLFRPAVLV